MINWRLVSSDLYDIQAQENLYDRVFNHTPNCPPSMYGWNSMLKKATPLRSWQESQNRQKKRRKRQRTKRAEWHWSRWANGTEDIRKPLNLHWTRLNTFEHVRTHDEETFWILLGHGICRFFGHRAILHWSWLYTQLWLLQNFTMYDPRKVVKKNQQTNLGASCFCFARPKDTNFYKKRATV